MDDQPAFEDAREQIEGLEPPEQQYSPTWPDKLPFGINESQIDIKAVKPHRCMTDIVQRGNYIHCNTGNHGMRIPAGQMLSKDKSGNWILVDQPLRDANGKIVAKNHTDVVSSK